MQFFVFDKTYPMVPRDSALVYSESASSVHPRVHSFKLCSFVSCFETVLLNRIKLEYLFGWFIWMIDVDAIYLRGLKDSF